MRYTYKFAYNKYNKRSQAIIPDTVAIEVDEYWYNILTALDKYEKNNERAETRRHVSYEVLEQLDDFLIPKQLYSDEKSPENELVNKERRDTCYVLYDKILRQCGFLTSKQYAAFIYRALCDMKFDEVAYAMRFECQMNENESSAKKHYYAAIKRLRTQFADEYIQLQKRLKEF